MAVGATDRCLAASTVLQAVNLSASHLVGEQSANGSWPGETDLTGSIGLGLLSAQNGTGNSSYLTAATKGGNFVVGNSSNFLGDEALFLSRLTTATGTASYANSAKTFYNTTVKGAPGSTSSYADSVVSAYGAADQSQGVYYLAHHTLAAYSPNVDATDKAIWRGKLITYLAQVNNSDTYPVLALGAATWALAQTGNGLDNTLISPAGSGSYYAGKTLANLPGLLAAQQVAAGAQAGSFNYKLDDSGLTGLTEDAAFGVLGLDAARKFNPATYNYTTQVASGRTALASGVEDPTGIVRQSLFDNTAPHFNVYNGELLEALPEPGTMGLATVGIFGALARRRRRRA